MNAMANMDEICRRVVAAYRRAYGDAIEAIYLYGSYARGDYDEDSDIDFAAIVKGERLDVQNKRWQLWEDVDKIDLEFDVLTSPTAIPAADFERYKNVSGYYKNIRKEGIRLE
ncbi:MAG: nucleotidyltransferase domain-containing protein [Selenomonadaceae bacterium]|nr:nucleotidyltransferase domain-containing protein [Selenomonadaceae bacterium]